MTADNVKDLLQSWLLQPWDPPWPIHYHGNHRILLYFLSLHHGIFHDLSIPTSPHLGILYDLSIITSQHHGIIHYICIPTLWDPPWSIYSHINSNIVGSIPTWPHHVGSSMTYPSAHHYIIWDPPRPIHPHMTTSCGILHDLSIPTSAVLSIIRCWTTAPQLVIVGCFLSVMQ